MIRYPILSFIIGLLAFSCGTEQKGEAVHEGLNLADMDTTIRPQDDLFGFANGGWIARTEIPPDRGSWNSFGELTEHNNAILLQVLSNLQLAYGIDRYRPSQLLRRRVAAGTFFHTG